MEVIIKVKFNESMQAKLSITRTETWEQLHAKIRKHLWCGRNRDFGFTLRYYDRDGDLVTIGSQSEWDELIKSTVGTKLELIISAPFGTNIEFHSPLQLGGLTFFTWINSDNTGWISHHRLAFNIYEQPILNNIQMKILPQKEVNFEGFKGISIEWKKEDDNPHTAYCLFYTTTGKKRHVVISQ